MSKSRNPSADDIIRASEIGEYVRCHRAWWLGRVQGVENANRAWMDAGTARHQEHGARVRRATLIQYGAILLAGIAIVALLLLILRLVGVF